MSNLSEFYNIKSQVFDGNEDSSRWDSRCVGFIIRRLLLLGFIIR